MYLPEFLPLPWRILKAWERISLNRPRWITPRDTVAIRDRGVEARLIAFGDVALIRLRADDALGRFDRVKTLLESADIRVANLEAGVTSLRQPASSLGAGMRAEPEALGTLTEAGFDVVSVANNHALDYGSEGLADCVELLNARGIDVCGVDGTNGRQRCVSRTVKSLKVGFLGFCDDINAASAPGRPRPSLWSPEGLAAIGAARRDVDVLIVQMHWGYEFCLHPLRRHRDQARMAVEAGAHAVICHHAHVPQGFEIWNDCLIAYGLGNGCMPINPYLINGHPWANRSVALEVGLAQDGIATVRLHPLGLLQDGSPVPLADGDRNSFLAGLAQMSARLRDEAFLDRCERTRLAYETVQLVSVLQEDLLRGGRAPEERVAPLELPRQQSLIEFLANHRRTRPLAEALRAVVAARRAGNLLEVLKQNAPELASALENVGDLYDWRYSLRARLP